jgi:hypothetical protein
VVARDSSACAGQVPELKELIHMPQKPPSKPRRKSSAARGDHILPPLKKNWSPGSTQIGLFIRNPDGSIIEMSIDSANAEVSKEATSLLRGLLDQLTALHDAEKNL